MYDYSYVGLIETRLLAVHYSISTKGMHKLILFHTLTYFFNNLLNLQFICVTHKQKALCETNTSIPLYNFNET